MAKKITLKRAPKRKPTKKTAKKKVAKRKPAAGKSARQAPVKEAKARKMAPTKKPAVKPEASKPAAVKNPSPTPAGPAPLPVQPVVAASSAPMTDFDETTLHTVGSAGSYIMVPSRRLAHLRECLSKAQIPHVVEPGDTGDPAHRFNIINLGADSDLEQVRAVLTEFNEWE